MREKRIEDKARARLFCARLMAVILAAGIAAAAVTGCGVKQEEPDDGKLKIVTTIFPQYDFVRAIAGGTGAVNVRMLKTASNGVNITWPSLDGTSKYIVYKKNAKGNSLILKYILALRQNI